MSINRRAARNFSGQAANIVVTFADRILLTAVLIRAWGVDVFSDWATVMAGASLLLLSEFGFQMLLGNTLVRAAGRGRARAFQRLVGIGLFFYASLGLGVLGLVVGIVVLADVGAMFELRGMAGAATVFLILGLYQTLRLFRSGIIQVFRGKGEVHQLVWTDARAQAAALPLAIVAAWSGGGPILVAAIYLVTEMIFGELWAIRLVRRRFPEVRLRIVRPSAAEVRALARSLPWYGWMASTTIVMLQLPVLIIAWLGLGGAPLIAFVVQRMLVNFGKLLSNSVSMAIGIELADLSIRASAAERTEGVRLLARAGTALAALLISGLLSFGEPLVRFWTGQAGLGSFAILFWLLLPMVVTAPAVPLQMLTFYAGRPKPQAAASFVQLAVGVPLAAVAGSIYGVVGVAFGVAIGEALGLGVVLPLLAARRVQVRYWALLAECTSLLIMALLWSGLTGWAAGLLFPLDTIAGLAAAIAGWSLAAALPVMLLGLPASSRASLLALARRLLYRVRRS